MKDKQKDKEKIQNTLGMDEKHFEEWKEEVRMEAIKLGHHARFWISNTNNAFSTL